MTPSPANGTGKASPKTTVRGEGGVINCLGEVNWNGLVIGPTLVVCGLEVGFEVEGEETEEGAEGCLKCSW